MNKKNYYWGGIFILIALYIIVSSLGIFPKIPVMTIIFTVLFAAWALKGLFTLSSFEFFIPIGCLGIMYDDKIGIEAITPWTWWFAIILLAIGFDMIFKNIKKSRHRSSKTGYAGYSANSGHRNRAGNVEDIQDGDIIHVKNMFSDISKYVNSTTFTGADIENSFGQANVYFNNAVMPAGVNGQINISNSFGETNVYIPHTWRVEVKPNSVFGNVEVHGQGNYDMDAHFLVIKADCSFGEINIYFE